MSEVKLVRRWPRRPDKKVGAYRDTPLQIPKAGIQIVAIGASTGGPPVIQRILSELPKDFPAPVLVVQHMAEGFIPGFAEWLKRTCAMPVQVATDGAEMLPGHVYVAPTGVQTKVETNGRLSCIDNNPENNLRPSISSTFHSIANVFGKNAVAVLLTGMGKDGAAELKLMKEKGAVTIAQDEESSVIFGMPGEAMKLDAATFVLPPEKIAGTLTVLVKRT